MVKLEHYEQETKYKLEVIEDLGLKIPSPNAKRKRRFVKCKCVCGNIIEIRKDQLNSIKSCGCARNQIRNEIPIGEMFNRLTITKDLGIIQKGKYRVRIVEAICDCGNIITTEWSMIRDNDTKSCGCLQKEKARENMKNVGKQNVKHGFDGTKIYKVWCGMKYRCYTSTTTGYEYYGGKGIEVCEEWKNNFLSFYNWAIENGYHEGLSIDRINPDGNYEPSNCQWITLEENTRKMHTDKKTKR